jgi:hypothetical protein
LINISVGDKFSKVINMNADSIDKPLRLLAALAILVIMLSGCTPTLKGGIDATNLDPDMHPPRKRVLVTEMVEQEIPEAPEVEIVDDGGEPEEPVAMQDGAEAFEDVPKDMIEDEPEDTREHLYIDKSSGPVSVGRGTVYHWVEEGGEVVMPSEEKPVEVAAAPAEEPVAEEPEVEPVEILEDERPDPGAMFRMDEVIALVQKYETAMKARDIGAMKEVFTKDANLSFTMDVPWQNAVLTESYDMDKFSGIHERGWGYDMDYDLSVTDISVSVSDDGTTAVAESKVTEQMTSQGNKVVSEYSLTFFVEKAGQKLLVTGGQAHGSMESSLVETER